MQLVLHDKQPGLGVGAAAVGLQAGGQGETYSMMRWCHGAMVQRCERPA